MERGETARGGSRVTVVVLVAVGVAAAGVTGVLALTGSGLSAGARLVAPLALAYPVLGGLVLYAVPRHAIGRLMVAAGLCADLALVALGWPGWLPLAWLGQWMWWPPFGLTVLALLVFPDGRLPSRRWRWVAVLTASAAGVGAVGLAGAALFHPRDLLVEVIDFDPRAQVLIRIAALGVLVVFGVLLAALWGLWRRWARAEGETRPQLACLLAAALLLASGLVLDVLNVAGAWLLIGVALPLGLTVAVLRYRLYGLDQIVNRTIVWLLMTLLVIAGFVALVTVLRDAVTSGNSSTASLAATGLIAVAFEPVRRRVQVGVDRMVYGHRDEPYEVIARLSALLGRSVDPTSVLPELTRSIVDSLQVPYVAVELETRDGARRIAEHGTATPRVESFPMLVHGERVGRLLVATRGSPARFTARENRLLGDVALHAAVAAEATRLIHELQLSRERLVTAREEERRRLRRDLHDGLGPTFAGMSMQVRAARKLLDGRAPAGQILDGLADDLRTCRTELRQLVDQLRPPALDQGLEPALRAECARFDGPISVRLSVDGDLSGLPAAVEVAAHRIVAEALTNVARHARAETCAVTVTRGGGLVVEVADDGVGIGASARRGVGLESMRERAEELNGECQIRPRPPKGTTVRVRLPISFSRRPVPVEGA